MKTKSKDSKKKVLLLITGSIAAVRVPLLVSQLAKDNYNTPFDGLKDWHLLRALAINRPELTTNYIHLLDQEPFDEN